MTLPLPLPLVFPVLVVDVLVPTSPRFAAASWIMLRHSFLSPILLAQLQKLLPTMLPPPLLLLHWGQLAPILETSSWMATIVVMVMLLPLKPPLLLLLLVDPSQAMTQFGWSLITHPSLPKA